MSLTSPKFVMLDTSTIVHLAAKPTELVSKRLFSVLRGGKWVPYITWHQLEELFAHQDWHVCESRIAVVASFPYLVHLKQPGHAPGEPFAGNIVDLRHYELSFLLENPTAKHEDIIAGVSHQVRGSFCSGEQFVAENLTWWRFFHAFLSQETHLHNEEIANLTHFPATDIKQALPDSGQSGASLSPEASARHFQHLARWLAKKITESGDSRKLDPKLAAAKLMREAYEESLPLISPGQDFVDAMMARDGVSRERLPESPTFEDMTNEAVFVAQIGINARNLLIPREEVLTRVRKEQIPSWVIWQEIDSRMKQFPLAEVGNVNDRYIVAFGPYVDVLNVDKRVAEILRQAGQRSTLLQSVRARVPTKAGLSGLIEGLN
jgi:hypothetical protein